MKKLLALMMCAMLLLSGCSPMTADGPGTGFLLRDLTITSESGETLDLTGLTAGLETATSETASGLRFSLGADGAESADAVLAVVGQYLYLSLDGAESAHTYALDLAKVVQALTNAIEGITEQINGILPAIFPEDEEAEPADEAPEDDPSQLTDEELEALMAQWEEAVEQAEDQDGYAPEAEDDETYASLPELSDEEMALLEENAQKRNEIIARCMTMDTQQIDGEDFTVITLDITAEDMAELVALTDTSGVGLSSLMAAAGTSCSLEGTITGNQDFSRFRFDLTPTVTAGGQDTPISIVADSMTGDGSVAISVHALQDGQEASGLSVTLAVVAVESADWLPEELGPDTVVLTEMSQERAGQALKEGLADYGDLAESLIESVGQAG